MPETKCERRATPRPVALSTRAEGDKQQPVVEGYAAVFFNASDPGTRYMLYSDLEERLDPHCFDRALAEKQPVRCFVNHDPNYRLGRVDKETLRLKVDATGLHYSADIPGTQVGLDTAKDLENGNLDGSSFSFSIRKQTWEDIKQPDGSWLTIRTITEIDRLYDVGPVSLPAYQATTAGIRSMETVEEVLAQRDAWRKGRAADQAAAVDVRLREVEVLARMDE